MVGEAESRRMEFIESAITEHKHSGMYAVARDSELYASGRNVTIMQYQKLLYTISGNAIPDNFSANHKCASGFFKRFVTQEVAYLLGNGLTLENEENKNKLGKDIDSRLYRAVKSALIEGAVFGFFNNGEVEFFKLTEFVPLYDEENGSLMAGIRFWQIDDNKPLRATLYEVDGLTEYIRRNAEQMQVLKEKRPYIQKIVSSIADGDVIYDGENYPSFPIVPLWANTEKQSEIVGKREQIDCYDLIKSGFANDLDEAAMLYWTITNAGGMTDMDLAKFKQKMATIKVANIDNGDEGSRAEAHTVDLPYQAREVYLTRLEKDLYKDFMALDVEQIAAGNVTATQIEAAYEPLNEKCDELEFCIIEFLNGIFAIAGIDDNPTFTRSQISNRTELIENLLQSAEYLGNDYVTEKLLALLGDADRVEEIIKGNIATEMDRFNADTEQVEDVATTEDAISTAEETVGKTLNGAQTQSLIAVMTQYSSGALTEGQAVAIISTSIGVTKEEARAIIRGE